MDIYWQHNASPNVSPKYDSPESLLQYSDLYYEDYCIHRRGDMMLRTFGFRSCQPDFRMLNRYLDRHVIHWIISGEGWFNSIPIKSGNVIYLKSHIPYNLSSNPDNPCVFAWITFMGEPINGYLERMGIVGKFQIFSTPNLQEIYTILYDLLYQSHPEEEIHLYQESAFMHLLSLSKPQKTDVSDDISMMFDPRLNVALGYIAEHYREPTLRIHHISDAVGISQNYFRKMFKDKMGVSVRDYIVKAKMDAAVTLLLNSNYNIAEIANMTGYTDYRQFYEIFHDRFGCSPKQYKKKKGR